MKKINLLTTVFLILIQTIHINAVGQNHKKLNTPCMWYNNKTNQIEHSVLPGAKLKNDKNTTTLTILFDLPNPIIYLYGEETLYFYPYNAENIDVPMGEYKLYVLFWLDENYNSMPMKYVLMDNIEFTDAMDTISVSSTNSIYEIIFQGVDENGNLLKINENIVHTINFNDSSKISALGTTFYNYPYDRFYCNQLIDSTAMHISEHVYIANADTPRIYSVTYKPVTRFTHVNNVFSNSPDDYLQQQLKLNINPFGDSAGFLIGANKGCVYRGFMSSFGLPTLWAAFNNKNSIDLQLFITNEYNGYYCSPFIWLDNTPDPFVLRAKNNALTIHDPLLFQSYHYFSPDSGAIETGKGLMFVQFWFANNRFGDYLQIRPDYFLQMNDYHYYQGEGSTFELYNKNNNLVLSTETGWDINNQVNLPKEKYTVNFSDTSYFINGHRGLASCISSFDLDNKDALPPEFNILQIRDNEGVPAYILQKNETATIHFSLADYYFDTLYRNYTYRSIVADSTRVFVKQYQSENWAEIVPQIVCEDTPVYENYGGYYYIAQIPPQYTDFDSSAIDVRVVFRDSSGNTTDYRVEPAVGVGSFRAPFYMPLTVADYYSTEKDSILTVSVENGLLANDSTSEPYPLTAQLVQNPANGLIDLNPDGSFSYTPNDGFAGQDSIVYKAVNGGTVFSVEQKAYFTVIDTTGIQHHQTIENPLGQNYPNPFSGYTTIPVYINEAGYAHLDVFDVTGKKVATLLQGHLEPGRHSIHWDGRNLWGKQANAGVYFYVFKINGEHYNGKMVIVK